MGASKLMLLPLLCVVNAQQQVFTNFRSASPARGELPIRVIPVARAASNVSPQAVRVPTPTVFRTPGEQPQVFQSAPLTKAAIRPEVISRTRETINDILQAADEVQSNSEVSSLFGDFNFDPAANGGYVYDPENPNKAWTYNYDPSKNSFRNGLSNYSAEEVIDTFVDQGEKILKAVDILAGNKLLGKLLTSSTVSTDPCAVAPEELGYVVKDLVEAVTSSRKELVSVLSSIQTFQQDEKNIPKIARAASEAVANVDPLIPKFSALLKSNKACEDSLKTSAASLNNIGGGLDALSKTNSVGASSFAAGAKASQAFSQFAGINAKTLRIFLKKTFIPIFYNFCFSDKFSTGSLARTCEESPTFTSDVFIGVSELIEGLSEITRTFAGEDPSAKASTKNIDQTVTLLKDGAVRIFIGSSLDMLISYHINHS